MDEVEFIFTKHFASNDKKKAMTFLRSQEHKESHMVTFFVGNRSLSLRDESTLHTLETYFLLYLSDRDAVARWKSGGGGVFRKTLTRGEGWIQFKSLTEPNCSTVQLLNQNNIFWFSF
uniref:Uncharacterized protein n=1 Tax=Kalanchoe fedtschenkoi TaxID=63787 RepID=A0A7N0VED7_KALFE